VKTVLVIGATGFVGTHTVNWLSGQPDIHLLAACRDESRLPAGFKGEVRAGDLRDEAYLEHLLDGVDVLVNAASWSSLHGHERKSRQLFLEPTMKLIDAWLRSRAARLVNISTASAAAPERSADALSEGIPRRFWPHLVNVVNIENELRRAATRDKTVVNLRLGIFAGEHYGLGVLPILLPRLKTHLVPWVQGGNTEMPLTDGRDLGQAMGRAALTEGLQGYESFNIVGPEKPAVRDVIGFLHQHYGYPMPHFSVPFQLAYPFAWLMEKLDAVVPWEPLIVRSTVLLLENTSTTNDRATAILGYQPRHHWQDAVRLQLAEMERHQQRAMSLAKAII